MLELVGSRRAVLLALDDVQWLDEPSLRASTSAVRRCRAPHALVVAARPEHGVDLGSLLGADIGNRTMQVGGLSLAALHEHLTRAGHVLDRPAMLRLRTFSMLSLRRPGAVINGETSGSTGRVSAIEGRMTNTAGGGFSTSVKGTHSSTGGGGIGVWGSHDGSGYGVYGTTAGPGYAGVFISGDGVGLYSSAGAGFGLQASSSTGTAVYASVSGDDAFGGIFTNSSGGTSSTSRVAVRGLAGQGSSDDVHPSGGFFDAAGEFAGANGVIGAASVDSTAGYGLIGLANNTSGYGLYAGNIGAAVRRSSRATSP